MRMTSEEYFILDFRPDYSDNNIILRVDKSYFEGKGRRRDDILDQFEFGYAITVHKSQGSEYEKVLLVTICQNMYIKDGCTPLSLVLKTN